MSDDRLTPEEQAVIGAALAMSDRIVETRPPADYGPKTQALTAAVAAYRKATAPPEPFERYIYRYTDGSWSEQAFEDLDVIGEIVGTWRCTVTPIERVR